MSAPLDRPRPELAQTQSFVGTPGQRPNPNPGAAAKSGSTLIGQKLGPYRVTKQIGQGGMGIVYAAQHERIGQRAAVKMLDSALSANPEFVRRFFTEACAATIAQHPGLVQVFDHGQLPSGELYILMEYVDGEPLARRLSQQGRLPELVAARLIRQIATAMAAVHDKGIVHRDLKPDNVFLVPDPEVEGGERIKILDFGLAKIVHLTPEAEDHRTTGTLIMGTPAYMSPEQCRGLAMADGKADVYSLGAMLYEMLAGNPPHAGATAADLMAQHLTQEPPPLLQKAPDVHPGLASLAHRMLAKGPEVRPTMQQVVIEISELGARSLRIAVAIEPERTPILRPLWLLGAALGLLALAAVITPVGWRATRAWLHAREIPEMVLLPGGPFAMGSSPMEIESALAWCLQLGGAGCQKERFLREHPPHPVGLSPFWLDALEVDNQHFAAWLSSQPGLRVDEKESLVRSGSTLIADLYSTYGTGGIAYKRGRFAVLSGYALRPVTQVTWDGAVAYCQDHGKRLPTEAEWEYAARGGQGFRFPWGDDEPRCEGTVFARSQGMLCGSSTPGPQRVGSSTQDRSALGVYDLAGNVSEWVADSFAAHGFYASCAPPCRDPQPDRLAGGAEPDLRVVRGGDWFSPIWMSRAAGRSRVARTQVSSSLGFRCARSSTRMEQGSQP